MDYLHDGLCRLCETDKDTAACIMQRFAAVSSTLSLYLDEIERFNPAYGLVKAPDRKTLIVKHILDSLAPLGHIIRLLGVVPSSWTPYTLADAGSGAGLPGIPLAVCLSGVNISLVERMGRRANFLRNAAAVLSLPNITVEETELEKAPQARFDAVVFRALSPLTQGLVQTLGRLLKPDTTPAAGAMTTAAANVRRPFLAAWKGRRAEAEAELRSLAGLDVFSHGAVPGTELLPLSVPFLEEERCLAILC